MTTLLVDGKEVDVGLSPGLCCLVAQGDMAIEAPGYYLVGPEQTVETAMGLSDKDWDDLRTEPNFLKIWNSLWRVAPPVLLKKSTLAVRHSVGLMMMLIMARTEGLKAHVNLPESYLPPQQCARLMTMIDLLRGTRLN